MLVYIIDGFNLVHKVPSLKNSPLPHRDLINYIRQNRLTGSRNNKVIIVFDGGVNEEAKREVDYEVFFSGRGTADDIIKDIVRKTQNKSQLVVVSDDREIIDCVRQEKGKFRSIKDFITIKKNTNMEEEKEISYTFQEEINKELREKWHL